jgi:hypothetical protein
MKSAYRKPEEAATDMRLVWTNAMLYNAPGKAGFSSKFLRVRTYCNLLVMCAGSKIYQMAKNLSDFWESQWSQALKEDPDRPPTTDEATAWVDMCHRLSSEEMGKLLSLIDSLCPQCLSKVWSFQKLIRMGMLNILV